MSFPLKYMQEAILESNKEVNIFNEIDKINKLIDESIKIFNEQKLNNLIAISNLKNIKLSIEIIKKYLEKSDFKK